MGWEWRLWLTWRPAGVQEAVQLAAGTGRGRVAGAGDSPWATGQVAAVAQVGR